jgi:hypothetical protein
MPIKTNHQSIRHAHPTHLESIPPSQASKQANKNTHKHGKVSIMWGVNKMLSLAVMASIALVAVMAEKVTVTGTLVDKYCWNDLGGVALDTGANLKLNPTAHTVHCLVEVQVCRDSGFVIVHKNGDSGEYEIQYELDDAGNTRAKELLYEVPVGERNAATGYEITMTGTTSPGSKVLAFDGTTGSMMGKVPGSAVSTKGMCATGVLAAAMFVATSLAN